MNERARNHAVTRKVDVTHWDGVHRNIILKKKNWPHDTHTVWQMSGASPAVGVKGEKHNQKVYSPKKPYSPKKKPSVENEEWV